MRESGGTLAADARALRSRPAQLLRDQWQCRLLAETKGKIAAVVMAFLAHSYFEAMETLLRMAYPGFVKVQPPLYSGPATIRSTGQITCTYIARNFEERHNVLVYDSEDDLLKEFRELADKLKLKDHEREEMFATIKRWVTRDDRIAPTVEYSGKA